MSNYGYTRQVSMTFEDAEKKVREELQKEGFGVLTEIDVKATLKKKLDVDFSKYKILGACNPQLTYKALQAEQELGLLLPCNIILYEKDNKTFAAAINPTVQMEKIGNQKLREIAAQVEDKLKKVIDSM